MGRRSSGRRSKRRGTDRGQRGKASWAIMLSVWDKARLYNRLYDMRLHDMYSRHSTMASSVAAYA
jgi:hypothetical protein